IIWRLLLGARAPTNVRKILDVTPHNGSFKSIIEVSSIHSHRMRDLSSIKDFKKLKRNIDICHLL
ncbi:MAG TPA: hypothetical protein PKJ47_13555, partial [Candidatus Limiplasma sp.]|nr:hypothetical protein [Candidatus Limiplasma sp.]